MTDATEVTEEEEVGADVVPPIILSLGKQKKKNIKKLKKGEGKLMDEVVDVIEQVHEQLGEEADGKVIVPVVIVYKEEPRKRGVRGLF